ncbi:MAG: NAD(+) synthase, partial [Crocinitomicaceae bacterium]|nr:NAD(+) synthase [Crocinitomicaceae bacterium]
KEIGVIDEIVSAKPTDGLWEDGRSDEDQIGASYPELEWAMSFDGNKNKLNDRQTEVLKIFRRLNTVNKHKIEAIPICTIPMELKK